MNEADLKTLRLAAPEVTDQSLRRFLRYQQVLVEQQEGRPDGPGWEERMASAHTKALGASGLTPNELARISSVCADYCAKRWAARELAARRAEAKQRIAEAVERGAPPPERQVAVLEAIEKERARLEDLRLLERRYGVLTIAMLRGREEELLTLHRAVTKAP